MSRPEEMERECEGTVGEIVRICICLLCLTFHMGAVCGALQTVTIVTLKITDHRSP